jgi:hypothetical protein
MAAFLMFLIYGCLVIIGPLLSITALNALFDVHIVIGLKTWFCMMWLHWLLVTPPATKTLITQKGK